MTRISLDQAGRIVDHALAKGVELGLNPLCLAVVDAGGHLLALKRDERASIMRPQIATALIRWLDFLSAAAFRP